MPPSSCWSGELIVSSAWSTVQSAALVMGSAGICLRYPADTRSSSDCGAFCLSRVYCEIRVRRVNRFCRSTDSRACRICCWYIGAAIDTKISRMDITTISSRRVKPALFFLAFIVYQLPVLILGAVERCARRFGVNVENVIAIPGVRSGIVLHGAHSPLGIAGHGIDGNAAQELQFFSADVHSIDQSIQVRRIAFRANLNLEGVPVSRVFVAVNRVPHFP